MQTKFSELPRGQRIWEKMNGQERNEIVKAVGGSFMPAKIAKTLSDCVAYIEVNADNFADVEARETPEGYWINA